MIRPGSIARRLKAICSASVINCSVMLVSNAQPTILREYKSITVASVITSYSIHYTKLYDDPETGARLDYRRFSNQLEQRVRDAFQTTPMPPAPICSTSR